MRASTFLDPAAVNQQEELPGSCIIWLCGKSRRALLQQVSPKTVPGLHSGRINESV